MFRFILLALIVFCAFTNIASASTHLDLQVSINMEKAQLDIEGSSSESVILPKNAQNIKQDETGFRYTWPFPASIELSQWQGEAFVSGQNLYLPSNWYPQTNARLTYSLTIDAPIVAVVAGKITEEVEAEGHYKARFTMDQPVEEIALFAGPYKIMNADQSTLGLRTYFYEGMDDLSAAYLERTAQYMERFSTEIGPFPFAQFNIIAAPVPAGYAFAGSTYIGAEVLKLPFIQETSLGHEILHNYWGNGVYPDYETGNWAEGLTTYMADYMTAEKASVERAKEMRLSWLRDYTALPKDQDKPVTSFKGKHGKASEVIGYHKVAFIFHMLRQRLGDAFFFETLRALWAEKAFQTASWQDIERLFSSTSHEDLSPFFAQWVTGSGAPEIKSISATTQHQKNAGWDMNITVVQGTPAFKTTLPLGIGTGNQVIQKNIPLNDRISRSSLSLQTNPYAVSIDPDLNLFRRLSANEAPPILRDVMLSKNVELILTHTDQTFRLQAEELANSMLDTPVKQASSKEMPAHAFIIMGSEEDILQRLKEWHLPDMPFAKNPEGSAHIWAGRLRQGIPYVVVSLSKISDITDIKRALPHYGQRSGLIFKGPTAIYKTNPEPRPMSVPIT
jgi:aminopeptidase N